MNLRTWHGNSATIHRARTLRPMDGASIGIAGPTYPAGTEVWVFLDDPERPGMADVELPNGKLVRTMAGDVEVMVP
jgi:hypothetical protein